MAKQIFQIETSPGDPVMAGRIKITPFSQSIRLVAPDKPVGFIYNRPVSVLAAFPDGQEEVIPIPDVTRRIQIALLGVAFLWTMLLITINLITNRRNSNG